MLVLVPLLISTTGTVAVLIMFKQAEAEELRQIHAKQINEDLSTVEGAIFDAAKAVARLAFTRDPKQVQRYKDAVEIVPQALAHLREVIMESAPPSVERERAVASIAKLDRESAKIKQVCDEGVEVLDSGDRPGAMAIFNTLKPRWSVFTNEVSDIKTIAEKIVGPEDPNIQIQNRARTTSLLIFAAVANVIAAALVTLNFNRDIVRRLRALMQNTERMRNRQVLAQPIAGSDEIAELDQVMFETAQSLAEVERMKREFLQMISHDLRTPLTSIQLFLNLLAEGSYGELAPRGVTKAMTANENARRLIKLVNDLLDIEKLESQKLELAKSPTAIGELIESAIASVKSFADKSSVSIESKSETIEVDADSDRVIQVLINLLGNAIKFSPPETSVRVKATLCNHAVRVEVTDEGRGVPAELQDKIFERFQQVRKEDETALKGTGLGLAICKLIVEQHGGTIGVESRNGEGSTFWFTLPEARMVAAKDATIAIND